MLRLRTEHHTVVQPTVSVDRSSTFGCPQGPARFPAACILIAHSRSKHQAAQNPTASISEEEKARRKAEKKARKVERRARNAEKKARRTDKRKRKAERKRCREEAAPQEDPKERRVVRWSTTRGARIVPVSSMFSCHDCGARTCSPRAIQTHCLIAKHAVAWPCAPLMVRTTLASIRLRLDLTTLRTVPLVNS